MGLQNSKIDTPFFQEALLNDKSFDFFPFCLDPPRKVNPPMLLCQEICPLCAQVIQRGVPETAALFAIGGGGARGRVQELQVGVKTIVHEPFSSGFHNGINARGACGVKKRFAMNECLIEADACADSVV